MKASPLPFAVILAAGFAAAPAEARFGGGLHVAQRIGPLHVGQPSDRSGRRRDGGVGFYPADVGPGAPPQFVPVPVPAAIPAEAPPVMPSAPRLILLGAARSRLHGSLPAVIYGDPAPIAFRP